MTINFKVGAKFLGDSVIDKIEEITQVVTLEQSNAAMRFYTFTFPREYTQGEIINLIPLPTNARVFRLRVVPSRDDGAELLGISETSLGIQWLMAQIGITSDTDAFSYNAQMSEAWIDFSVYNIESRMYWYKVLGLSNYLTMKIDNYLNDPGLRSSSNFSDSSIIAGESFGTGISASSLGGRTFSIDSTGTISANYSKTRTEFNGADLSAGDSHTFTISGLSGYTGDGVLEIKIGANTHTFTSSQLSAVNNTGTSLVANIIAPAPDSTIYMAFKGSTGPSSIKINNYAVAKQILKNMTENLTGQKFNVWIEYIQE